MPVFDSHLCSTGVLCGVVVAPHAQHILGAVVELREAVELAVVEVDGWLVDAIEGGVRLIGAVQKRLQEQAARVKVSGSADVDPLARRTHFVL